VWYNGNNQKTHTQPSGVIQFGCHITVCVVFKEALSQVCVCVCSFYIYIHMFIIWI